MYHLDILPGVHHLIWRVSKQSDVSPPGVEVGSVAMEWVRSEEIMVAGKNDLSLVNSVV